MKKFLIPVLLSILILSGCAVHHEEDATTTIETAPPGMYVPASTVEAQTNGAVRLYELPEGSCSYLSAIGDQLLIMSDGDPAKLTVLTGTDCIPTAELLVDKDLLSSGSSVLYNGYAYYDEAENQAIFLDPQLQEIKRIDLPENIIGTPIFAPDGEELFYCTETEIRAFHVENKLSRLVKSHSYQSLELVACQFDGEILVCRAVEEREGELAIFVSAKTGETTCTDSGVTALYTYEKNYIVFRNDGVVPQKISGALDNAPQLLNLSKQNIAPALELGGLVAYHSENGNLELDFYDLSAGKKTASIALSSVGTPEAFLADRWSGCIWILCSEPESGDKILLRWDKKMSAVSDEGTCFAALYTQKNPDKEGLKACSERVSALNKTYGIRIRVWEDAVDHPTKYVLKPEYQTTAINAFLDELEPVLAEFPRDFLKNSIKSRIRICFVRSVDREAKAAHYWNGSDVYIVLTPGLNIREAFIAGLGSIVDSHVLGNCTKYDKWDTLNPEGFVYGSVDEKYLSGEGRAFVDESSMQSAAEDRSSIYYAAMMPDNGELFSAPIVQNKLLLICQAIRDAWNLEKSEAVFPWEQYLKEPIAYKK